MTIDIDKRGRKNNREVILDAATELAAEIGIKTLTLQSVADRAGVSKGGLLYHFPSKMSLLKGLIVRYVDQVKTQSLAEVGTSADTMRQLLRSRIEHEREHDNREAACGMLAVIAEEPELLEPIRDHHNWLWQQSKQSSEPFALLLPWLAIEGLMFLELLGASPLSETEREATIDRILHLVPSGVFAADGVAE